MQVFSTEQIQKWGQLNLPIMGISADWKGSPLDPPLGFSLLLDPASLWFVATRNSHGLAHPDSKEHCFHPQLWKYDVTELFLANPQTGTYLEINLAPNGAWWAAKFSSPRALAETQPKFLGIQAYSSSDDESWTCALSIPQTLLREEIDFGPSSTANVCAILNSPNQSFHSAHSLPGFAPDFHQPACFPEVNIIKLPED